MSEADKMFEELGYEKVIDDKSEIVYRFYNEEAEGMELEYTCIVISKFWKSFRAYAYPDCGFYDDEYNKLNYNGTAIDINIKELQAINKKVEELGW